MVLFGREVIGRIRLLKLNVTFFFIYLRLVFSLVINFIFGYLEGRKE